jgi:sugar lactone lactonase YvrE
VPPRIERTRPVWAIEGGRITLDGSGFPVDGRRPPEVRVGDLPARVVFASPSRIVALVPPGLEGGRAGIRVEGAADAPVFIGIAAPFATGLHQVDNPVFDRSGHLYVTYSGTRGQQVPVSIFRVHVNGTRETFSSGIVNPTSMAIDPDGRLYVSSRFEGTVYRVGPDGSAEPFASDLGIPCGLAFSEDGTLFVGDRSGTIFRVDREGRASTFASLPPSVAAFHLAMGRNQMLYVTAPTLASYDSVYCIDEQGRVSVFHTGFGRPQGIGFDSAGSLYVVDALAGLSGMYRLHDHDAELVLSGQNLIGFAFDALGDLVVCSNETAYRLTGQRRGP